MPNGARQYITLKVHKDNASGDWLVHYGFNTYPGLIVASPNQSSQPHRSS
uniref:Neprosin domain-containing protein n=1 Tax=Leersia perrieri TaxID=77586 RepID=A0A0D9WTB3_9ORYZ